MNKGVGEASQKLYDSAIRDLKQAALIDPSNAAASYNLGIVFKDERKWPDASDAFSSALKLDPDNPALHYELGNALYEQGKISHTLGLDKLEDEMTSYTVDSGFSPDRLDALVHCLTELMLVSRVRAVFHSSAA